jgi:hypothetical protein
MSGVGLDVGTCFIVSAREKEGEIIYTRQRDGFFTVASETALNARFIEQGLKKSGVSFFKKGTTFYIIGEAALEKAVERRAILQRPLSRGVINSKEPEALEMIRQIIGGVLGSPIVENEKCIYSVPESPIDAPFDIVYHKNILNQMLTSLGYSPHSLNEAEAVAYAELMDEGLTGIAISFGAGATNFAIMSNGKAELKFSIAKGGDYIDERVSTSLGLTPSLVQIEKENGIDLNAPIGRIQSAISIYYDHLISIIVSGFLSKATSSSGGLPKFQNPITVVISGGTSIPVGFLEKLSTGLREANLPFKIGEIRKAEKLLESVAKGCWLAASLQ